jgi:hypothetical protein
MMIPMATMNTRIRHVNSKALFQSTFGMVLAPWILGIGGSVGI